MQQLGRNRVAGASARAPDAAQHTRRCQRLHSEQRPDDRLCIVRCDALLSRAHDPARYGRVPALRRTTEEALRRVRDTKAKGGQRRINAAQGIVLQNCNDRYNSG